MGKIRMRCFILLGQASVKTVAVVAAAAVVVDDDDDEDDDDASQFDIIAPHPGHLLLISMGPCSTTRLVF